MAETGQPSPAARPRPTPWDVIFDVPAFDEARFELLREQAAAFGATRASELLLLPAAGELLRELAPVGEADARHMDLVAQAGALLFHAFRFWLHGRTVVSPDAAALRTALQGGTHVGEWRFRAPSPAGYMQLPLHLLWARVAEGAAAEPVDGFFWSAPAREERGAQEHLDLLLALGVRRGRPGVSLVDASMEGTPELQHWGDVDARPGGTDFENVLPGGELQGYHALTTQAEVLRLASLCFWLVDAGAGETAGGDARAGDAGGDG
jgi:hypothetical protein